MEVYFLRPSAWKSPMVACSYRVTLFGSNVLWVRDKVYFCEMYPTCVSSKLCEFIIAESILRHHYEYLDKKELNISQSSFLRKSVPKRLKTPSSKCAQFGILSARHLNLNYEKVKVRHGKVVIIGNLQSVMNLTQSV